MSTQPILYSGKTKKNHTFVRPWQPQPFAVHHVLKGPPETDMTWLKEGAVMLQLRFAVPPEPEVTMT